MKYIIFAVLGSKAGDTGYKKYKWVKGSRLDREKHGLGDLKADIFCKECMYERGKDCPYRLDNCPYRKKSQEEYLKKHGKFEENFKMWKV